MRVFAIKNKKATRRFVVSVLALAILAVQPLLSLNLSAVFAAAQPSDVIVDNTAPSQPSVAYKEDPSGDEVLSGGYTNSQYFTFKISSPAGEGVDHYELKYWNAVDGSQFKEDSPWKRNSIPSSGEYKDNFTQGEGKHYFAFRACDAAKNCSEYGEPFAVTYDKTAPNTVLSVTIKQNSKILGCDAYTNQRLITIDWNDDNDQNLSHYNYQNKDGGTIRQPTDSAFTSSIRNTDGYYEYRVQAVDKSGNEGEWSEWCGVTLDRQSPDASLVTDPNSSSDNPTNIPVKVIGSVSTESSIKSHWFEVADPNGSKTYVYKSTSDKSYSFALDTAAGDGRYTVRYVATDKAGNRNDDPDYSNQLIREIFVDTTGPVVKIASPQKGTIYAPGDVKVYGTVDTSAVGTVAVTLNSVTQNVDFDQDGNWTALFTNLVAGQYDLSAIASDAVGNIGEADVANVIVSATGVSIIFPQLQPEQRPVSNNGGAVTAQTPAAGLTPFAFAANNLQGGNSPVQTPTPAQDEAEVLAEETAIRQGDVKAAEVADPTALLEEGSKQRDFSGMAYFWWLLAITTILGAVIFTIVRWR